MESRIGVGNIFTHNHPSVLKDENNFTTPLSMADIFVAVRAGFKQIRAVGGENKWIMDVGKKISLPDGTKSIVKDVYKDDYFLNRYSIYLRNAFTSYNHVGQDEYIKLINEGVSNFQANRKAQYKHYLEVFKFLNNTIKGINIYESK